jgi:hypothetical protein
LTPHIKSHNQRQEYLVGEKVVDGPWQTGNAVEPEAARGEDVLEGDDPDVVAVGVGDVERTLKKLDEDLELPAGLNFKLAWSLLGRRRRPSVSQ